MSDPVFTLQELSDASGIEARTIRSYIERDLLPGPSGMGPKASYGAEHLDRLNVIQRLRDAHRGIQLDQIRSFLGQLTREKIAAIAAGDVKIDGSEIELRPASSALSYLMSLAEAPPSYEGRSAARARTGNTPSPAAARISSPPARTPFQELLDVLGAGVPGGSVSRSVRSETWHRVPITPDIELSVRGELDTDQLALLQRVGDYLRHLLLKGTRT